MNKSLRAQLDDLIGTMPNLSSASASSLEVVRWVGHAQGLVYAVMGESKEVEELKNASERLNWDSSAPHQIIRIVQRARTRAASIVGRPAPDWIHELQDKVLSALLEELYGAFNNEYRVLAAIGARTAFDRATETLGINPSLTFAKKLEKAQSDGLVGTNERNALEVMITAGSAAAHRGWRPSQDELTVMMGALESFLHREFVTNRKLVAIKDAVPPKPPRP
jgi:Domain of unknown function (DUF4145)